MGCYLRVVEVRFDDMKLPAAPGGRPPTLELVVGDVDARLDQGGQSRVQTLLPDQTFEVFLLASGHLEERTIGAAGLSVDVALGNLQKPRLALLQALTNDHFGLLWRDGLAQEGAEVASEAPSSVDGITMSHVEAVDLLTSELESALQRPKA